jgi:hypothetical protein
MWTHRDGEHSGEEQPIVSLFENFGALVSLLFYRRADFLSMRGVSLIYRLENSAAPPLFSIRKEVVLCVSPHTSRSQSSLHTFNMFLSVVVAQYFHLPLPPAKFFRNKRYWQTPGMAARPQKSASA